MINKLYNENCLDTLKRIPNEYLDMIITSPPYQDMDSNFNPIYKHRLRDYKGYTWDFKSIINELYRTLKTGGLCVWVVNDMTINGSESLSSCYQKIYFNQVGFNIHDTMIYQKNNFSNPSNNRYHQIFEYVFIFSKDKPKTFNPIKDRQNIYAGNIGTWGKNTVTQIDGSKKERKRKIINELGMRYNIWKYKTSKNGQEDIEAYKHPAIFPIELAKDHIISWSNPNDIIYDCFAGSGTTGIACLELNRNFILSEISSEYCDIIQNRFKQKLNLEIDIIKE